MRDCELVVHAALEEKGAQAAPARGKAASGRELVFLLACPDGISVSRAAEVLIYAAPFRSLACLRLIWPYQALDNLRPIPTGLRRIAAQIAPTSHLSGGWHSHASR